MRLLLAQVAIGDWMKMVKLFGNLVYFAKRKALGTCLQFMGNKYATFRTVYTFCLWETELVGKSNNAVPIEFTYDTREIFYEWVNKQVLKEVPIDYLEFGVYKGESIQKWLSINKCPESRFWGFDSFEGLPEDWDGIPKKTFDVNGAIPNIADARVVFVKGLFQATLPEFVCTFEPKNQMVIHIDADLYSSTLFSLIHLNKIIKSGTVLIFDDFATINHEFAAFCEFVRVCSRKWNLIGYREGFNKVAIKIL